MTTTKSYSEKFRFLSIYKSALKNQLSFGIVSAIVFIILLPLIYFVTLANTNWGGAAYPALAVAFFEQYGHHGVYVEAAHGGVIMAALVIMAIVAALINNSHLHSKMMTDLYHSLPVRRPHLLTANMLAALTAILAPFLAVYLVTILCQVIPAAGHAAGFGAYLRYIGVDLVWVLVATAVAYVFTTFVAVGVGTTFDAFALTNVLGLMPLVLWMIYLVIWDSMTYGAALNRGNVMVLSPFFFGFQRFGSSPSSSHLGTMAVWLLIGAGLYIAAIVCYNRRKSEIAGQTQSQGPLQTVAKCFGAFCGGALFLAIFYKAHNLLSWTVAILAGAVLIGFIVEVVLSRGFSSFRKNLKWLLASGVLCVLLVVVINRDPFGFIQRIPAAGEVASVTVTYDGRLGQLSQQYQQNDSYEPMQDGAILTQPESIAVAIEAHRMAVSDQPPRYDHLTDEENQLYPYQNLRFYYTLKNGRTIRRNFSRVNLDAYTHLSNLEDKSDFLQAKHALFSPQAFYTGVSSDQFKIGSLIIYPAYGLSGSTLNLSDTDSQRLVEAVRQDMLEETLEEIRNPQSAALGYLGVWYTRQLTADELQNQGLQRRSGYYGDYTATGMVVINKSYTRTQQVLAELNLLDGLQNLSAIDAVSFRSAYVDFGNAGRVCAIEAGVGYGESRYTDIYEQISTENPAEIAAALSAGRNQLLITGKDYQTSDTVLMSYYHQNSKVGSQLARISDLPSGIQQQLQDLYAQEQFHLGSVIYPDKAPQQIETAELEISVGNSAQE